MRAYKACDLNQALSARSRRHVARAWSRKDSWVNKREFAVLLRLQLWQLGFKHCGASPAVACRRDLIYFNKVWSAGPSEATCGWIGPHAVIHRVADGQKRVPLRSEPFSFFGRSSTGSMQTEIGD